MNLSPDARITGVAAANAPKAEIGHDLRVDAVRHSSRVDPRLFDPRLAAEYEKAAAQARELGRAEGFSLGYAQGRAKAEADMELELAAAHDPILRREREREESLRTVVERLRAAAESFEQNAVQPYVDAAVGIAPAAFALAQAIVGHELSVSHDVLLDAVRRVAAVAPHGHSILLHLSPSDAATVSERRDAIEEILGRPAVVLTDPGLSPGDLIADSGASRIDARITSALARVADLLGAEATLKSQPAPPNAIDGGAK